MGASLQRQLFAGELRPAELEDVPLGLLEVCEDGVGGAGCAAATRLERAEGPALPGLVHEQHVERIAAGLPHQVQQILQVRTVLAERIGLELPREVEPFLVEGVHGSDAHRAGSDEAATQGGKIGKGRKIGFQLALNWLCRKRGPFISLAELASFRNFIFSSNAADVQMHRWAME